ncbi:MAG: glycosyltransferase family 4 protein [Cyanobacteria bacterium J06634_6]
MQPYEQVMPGSCLKWGGARFHINWHLPWLYDADVIILNGYQSLVAQLILHTHAKKVPCIFWGEKMVADSAGVKGRLQQLLAAGLNNCKGIAAIGSKAKEDYSQRFPSKPIFNISYYCNLDGFSQKIPQRPRRPITILFCGQMISRKGVDLLLNSFQQLLDVGYDARLLLVGREADLPEMLQALPNNSVQHIEFAGFQAPEDLPHYFQRADIFVLPSRYDGWGVVVNQALGAGLPIICSDAVGAAPDLIEPGVNGFAFSAGDAPALFSALKYFFEQPERIGSASQASLQKAPMWSPSVGAKHWLDAFKTVIDL